MPHCSRQQWLVLLLVLRAVLAPVLLIAASMFGLDTWTKRNGVTQPSGLLRVSKVNRMPTRSRGTAFRASKSDRAHLESARGDHSSWFRRRKVAAPGPSRCSAKLDVNTCGVGQVPYFCEAQRFIESDLGVVIVRHQYLLAPCWAGSRWSWHQYCRVFCEVGWKTG